MKAELSLESDSPELLKQAVGPSLRSSEKVRYKYKTDQPFFEVEIQTDGLGSLRGATDNVFRLVSLSEQLR